MNFDKFIILNSFLSFLLFVIAQTVVFYFLQSKYILRCLGILLTMGIFLNIAGSFFLGIFLQENGYAFDMPLLFFSGGVSLIIYVFAVFLYVNSLIGAYETSIRIRLIRELFNAGPRGLTREGILAVYNAETVLKARLERLSQAGFIDSDGQYYKIKRQPVVFLFLNWLTGVIKKVKRVPPP